MEEEHGGMHYELLLLPYGVGLRLDALYATYNVPHCQDTEDASFKVDATPCWRYTSAGVR